MGADMLIQYIYFKQGIDLESIKKKMLERADTPTLIAELLGKPDESQYQAPYIKVELGQENEEHKTFEEMVEEFKDTINEVFGSLELRDVSSFDFMGYTIFITGGLSWGDSPTETFDTFERFWEMPELITGIHE
jgi:predicted nuclease with TOPRIM domain